MRYTWVVAALLNIDLGELPDESELLFAAADIANIACGGHAGDGRSMALALERCARHRTRLGAHPSYPDRASFGRARLAIEPAEIQEAVHAQCAALRDLAAAKNEPIAFVKAHGALYHAANSDPKVAQAFVAGAVSAFGRAITLIALGGGALQRAAVEAGLAFAREGFADRLTRPDGSLAPRTQAGAVLSDPVLAAARARELIDAGNVDTICVHGDTPGAQDVANAVREVLGAKRW